MGSFIGKVGQFALSAIAILLFALWGAFYLGLLNVRSEPYDCQNMKSEITSLSEKNAAQNGGVHMIGIINERPLTISPTLVECSAKAKWSNATDTSVTYKAYKEGGQWWLQYTAN